MPARSSRILLIGNYAPDQQYSMRLYARSLAENLRALGVAIDLIEPAAIAGRLTSGAGAAAKLAGYIDKYVLFPIRLRWRARGYACVHIADHSNAPYRAMVGKRPVIVTCHDLFAIHIMQGEVPGQRFGRSGALLQRWVLANLRRTARFVAISDATANDLRQLVGHAPDITVIPNALSPFFKAIDAAEAAAEVAAIGIDAEAPFFLHVGGNQYYKNRPGVVRLFEALALRPAFARHRLVMAGKPPDAALAAALAASPVRERIDVRIAPNDAQVRALYNRAAALLFISLQEGFGWPILEAQACGCPVVTSDAEPMRSVAGGAAILVDPHAPEAAASAIEAGLATVGTLRSRGDANVEHYRPERIYGRYELLYRETR